MSPKIFNLHLSDETTSLFFLLEGFTYDKPSVSTKEIIKVWNSTDQMFAKSLKELEERNVIRKVAKDGTEDNFYRILSDIEWRYNN